MWQPVDVARPDERARPYAPTKVTGRDVTRILWGSLLLAAPAYALSASLRLGIPFVAILVLSTATLVAARIVTAAKPPPAEPPLPRAQADPRPADRPFGEVSRMEERLAWGGKDMMGFERTVRPVLIRLADDRLQQRHGITRASHPERARQLLGDELWHLVTGPSVGSKETGPTPERLKPLVERLERL